MPSQPGVFYFGGVGGGVWKTTDSGVTWTNITDGFLNTSSVGAVAVADSDPNVIYVGMGEHAIRGVMTSHGDGVYKSTDAGRTWTHMGLPRSRAIARIRIHPTDPDRVYVAVQGAPYGPTEERGIYRSRDGGATWDHVLYIGETAGASDLAIDPTNPRILYAAFWDHLRTPWEVRSGGEGSGLHKSTDSGETWEEIGGDPDTGFPELKGKMSVAVSANPDRIYALVEADPDGGLFRSDNAGETWTLVNETWTTRARAWYYIKVFADPQNPDVVWITNAPLSKSIDGGKTFTRVRTPHGDNHHLWIHPDDSNIMINSNDGGANVSHSGGASWSAQQNQPTAQFYRVNVDNRFPYHVYGGQQDNSSVSIASRSFGSGIGWKDWYSVGGCESAYTAFDPNDPVRVYAGCYMGQISEWDARTRYVRNVMAYPTLPAALPSRDMKYRFNWNAPIVASHHDPSVVYHASNVLLKTVNRGMSWTEVSGDLTRNDDEKQGPGGGPITNEGAGGEIYGTIFYVAESPHEASTIWTGSDDGQEIEDTISALYGSVNRLRDVREQIEDFVARTKDEEGGGAVEEAGNALVEKLTEVEDALIQKRTVDGQTVINFPSRLNHHFSYLRGAVDGSEVGVIDGARERYGDLKAQWDEQKAKLDPLLGAELDAFNALVREKAIPLVINQSINQLVS